MIPVRIKTLSFVPMLIVLVCMPFSCKRERAVSCVSKSLMPIETRYVTHDLVLLAIGFVLQDLASLFWVRNLFSTLIMNLGNIYFLIRNMICVNHVDSSSIHLMILILFTTPGWEIVLPMHIVVGNKWLFL